MQNSACQPEGNTFFRRNINIPQTDGNQLIIPENAPPEIYIGFVIVIQIRRQTAFPTSGVPFDEQYWRAVRIRALNKPRKVIVHAFFGRFTVARFCETVRDKQMKQFHFGFRLVPVQKQRFREIGGVQFIGRLQALFRFRFTEVFLYLPDIIRYGIQFLSVGNGLTEQENFTG